MEQTELICLIEDAEQGGDLQTVDNGKAARVELDNMNKKLAALREAGEKMAERLRENRSASAIANSTTQKVLLFSQKDAAALAEWEAANK